MKFVINDKGEYESVRVENDEDEKDLKLILVKALFGCKDFEEFFYRVSTYKDMFHRDELHILLQVMNVFQDEYDFEKFQFLKEYIIAWSVLPMCNPVERGKVERDYQIKIIDNFKKIFPEYKFVGSERKTSCGGRIDILAEKDNRPVIIELKVGKKNPSNQLLAYATDFNNPILIGISEEEVDSKNRSKSIQYLTYKELFKRIQS